MHQRFISLSNDAFVRQEILGKRKLLSKKKKRKNVSRFAIHPGSRGSTNRPRVAICNLTRSDKLGNDDGIQTAYFAQPAEQRNFSARNRVPHTRGCHPPTIKERKASPLARANDRDNIPLTFGRPRCNVRILHLTANVIFSHVWWGGLASLRLARAPRATRRNHGGTKLVGVGESNDSNIFFELGRYSTLSSLLREKRARFATRVNTVHRWIGDDR